MESGRSAGGIERMQFGAADALPATGLMGSHARLPGRLAPAPWSQPFGRHLTTKWAPCSAPSIAHLRAAPESGPAVALNMRISKMLHPGAARELSSTGGLDLVTGTTNHYLQTILLVRCRKTGLIASELSLGRIGRKNWAKRSLWPGAIV